MQLHGLIDIGANLAHESFDPDRDAVLERARAAGVVAIVVTGSDLPSARSALALAQGARGPVALYATAGLHPHHAAQWDAAHAAAFAEMAAAPGCVALGECGLDYYRDLAPRAQQRAAFAAQLELAAAARMPVFLHQRDAHADFLALLREHRGALAAACVHCFTDTRDALRDYLALDCHVGITGWICDERRGAHLVEAVRDIPADRLLLETDAPYLLPRNAPAAERRRAGRRNEPMFLPAVALAVAAARREEAGALARQTAANARSFFRLA